MDTSEYRDEDSDRVGTVSEAPTKFIQICASQNDLFALDEEGNIYQYNFNAKAWAKLIASRSYEDRAAPEPSPARRPRNGASAAR
jgi:hypothetical protein